MANIIIKGDFGDRLNLARKNALKTQSDLAEALGVHQATIAAYEKDRIKPKFQTLLKIAYFLGVAPEWLATGEGDSKEQGFKAAIAPTREVKQVPLYSMEQLMDIEFNNLVIPRPTLRPCLARVSQSAFAMKTLGDSMCSNSILSKISFPPDSIVTFDRMFKKESGKCYLIKIDDLITFKQLYFGDFETKFIPLNNSYSDYTRPNGDYELIAQAVYIEIDLVWAIPLEAMDMYYENYYKPVKFL